MGWIWMIAKGSGTFLVRLYKDAGTPTIECSATKFWKALRFWAYPWHFVNVFFFLDIGTLTIESVPHPCKGRDHSKQSNLVQQVNWFRWVDIHDKCHAKIDLFKVKKISKFSGLQNCVKFDLFEVLWYIWYQNNQKPNHLPGTSQLLGRALIDEWTYNVFNNHLFSRFSYKEGSLNGLENTIYWKNTEPKHCPLGSYHFFRDWGAICLWGAKTFWDGLRGGAKFFKVTKGGRPKIFQQSKRGANFF